MNRTARRAAVVTALVLGAASVAPLSAGASAAEPGGPPCEYSVGPPTYNGDLVWGEAHWRCDLLSSTATEIHVRIVRDGEVLKDAVFRNNGPVDSSFTTAVPCEPGDVGLFTVFTFGWDGSGPIVYTGAESGTVKFACR